MITKLIGRPSDLIINEIEDGNIKDFMLGLPRQSGTSFKRLFENANDQAVDLLKKMLVFDPQQRITIDQALAHPYMERLHLAEDEPTGEPVQDFDFDFELYSLKIDEYKQLIYEEIQLYHSQQVYEAYKKNCKDYPKGMLSLRYPRERLRTMYRKESQIIQQIEA